MKSLFVLLLLSIPFLGFAQDPPQTKSIFGIENREMIARLLPLIPEVGYTESSSISVQSLKPYMMPVREMVQNGSASSYLLASCLEYYVNLKENYKVNLSPDYLSLNLLSQGKKPSFKDAFLQLAETGTVSAAIMPYGSNTINTAVYATQKFKINNYLILFRSATKPKEKIFDIRRALLRGNPVVIEVKGDKELQKAQFTDTYSINSRGTEIFPLIIVGFDEDRNAFELTSPWGSSWGKGGYLWVSYDNLVRQAQTAYVMIPQANF